MKKRKRYEKNMKYRRAAAMAISNFLAMYLLIFVSTHVSAAPSVQHSFSLIVNEAADVSGNQLPDEEVLQEESTEAGSTEESTSMVDKLEIPKNTHEKNYSMKGDTNRIKEQSLQTEQAQEESQAPLPEKAWASVDKSLLLLLIAALISVILIFFSYKKLLQIFVISSKHPKFFGKLWREKNKVKKRKKAKQSKRNGYRKRQKSEK